MGLRLGVAPPDIVMALEHYTPSNSRSQYIADTPHHNNLVVDAYNANPSSMHTAIENFLSTSGAQAKYLILGDMFELGSASREEHLALVQRLARETTDITCYLVGKEFAALESKTKAPHLHYFPSTEILAEQLRLAPIEHAFILVKASRGMHFESLVELC